jgi:hypothetical protein
MTRMITPRPLPRPMPRKDGPCFFNCAVALAIPDVLVFTAAG